MLGLSTLSKIARLRAWKICLHDDMHLSMVALFYLLLTKGIFSLSLELLTLIGAISLYLSYAFLINDYCDMESDKLAGKRRVLHELKKWQSLTLIVIVMSSSFTISIMIIRQPLFTALYSLSFLLATFYSSPPVRFKCRGELGVICDALVEKPLPALLVFTFFNHFQLDTLLYMAMLFALQIKIITHHYIDDYEADLKSHVKTFVVKIGLNKAKDLLNSYLRPLAITTIIIFCLNVFIQIPETRIPITGILIGYSFIRELTKRGVLSREEEDMPLYVVYFYLVLHGLLPLLLAFLATLIYVPYIILMSFTFVSEYYFITTHVISVMQSIGKWYVKTR